MHLLGQQQRNNMRHITGVESAGRGIVNSSWPRPTILPLALSLPLIDRLSRDSGIYRKRSNRGERSYRPPGVQRSVAACHWRDTSGVLRVEQSPRQTSGGYGWFGGGLASSPGFPIFATTQGTWRRVGHKPRERLLLRDYTNLFNALNRRMR